MLTRGGSGVRRRGLWLAVLGPDGSGKSSVLDGVARTLGPSFSGTRRFHLRPHLGGRRPRGTPPTDPHSRRDRSAPASWAKLVVWWVDYCIGYLVRVRPTLRESGLVLFDRYFDDLLVDPRRYRYGASRKLAELVGRAIPRPHVVIVLDAPAVVLRSRKREVPPAETHRQREAYRQLAARMPNARLIDAARPLSEVVAEVATIATGREI